MNGLNQYTNAGGVSFSYDARGNLTSDGTLTYSYGSANLLTSISNGVSLFYDGAGRLIEYDHSISTRMLYDGLDLVAEIASPSGAILRRYVHGPGVDDPLVWYEGPGAADRRYLGKDERGSVIAVSQGGTVLQINAYDEWGIPAATNTGRFQYTGQAWLAELGLYYYKARIYSPTLGRFLQTDPIGYEDQVNLYAYVGNDPVNLLDPTGMSCEDTGGVKSDGELVEGGGIAPSTYCDPENPEADGPTLEIHAKRPVSRPSGPGPSAPPPSERPQSPQCSSSPSDGILGSARAVLETTATGADIATLGFTAGGVTAPIAVATKLVGYGAEAGLLGVNLYDGFANGSWGGLEVQAAGAATRLIPGGRALQSGLKAARGPTGVLRNSLGQFRSSYLNNPAVAEAGDLALQNGAQAAAGAVACR